MSDSAPVEVYQLHIWLREISPMIWRRLLVRSDSTIADLHYTLQIAFGWSDAHLHRFVIYGKDDGLAYIGGISFADDPTQVRLSDFLFRRNARFRYEYDFGDLWQHEIRLECTLPLDPRKTYPVCVGGARATPPEDCGGAWVFMALQQQNSPWFIADRLIDLLSGDPQEIDPEEVYSFEPWLNLDHFDRRVINHRLRAYGRGNDWR
jgi:hypothetical protein